MDSEDLLKAYKEALRFSNLSTYEDYNKHHYPASSIMDVIFHSREKLGKYIDYDILQEEEWNTAEKRLGFALCISQSSHPFEDSGIKKFAKYCIEVNDEIALKEIEYVLSCLD